MKKKILAVILSAAMTAALLTGCGSGAQDTSGAQAGSEGSASADSGEVQEITWMFWDDLNATEDLISKGYAETVERFNADYEGQYHVTVITTNLEEYYPKLNALVASGETPDAVFSQMTYDGKIYAVPLNIAAACAFYNTEMFEAAGVEVPTTWDEMLDACQKLQDAGYTPITISAGTAWCLSMVAGYLCEMEGVDLAALADGSASWEDGKVESAAAKLVELSKYFQKTAAGDTNDVATANFYNEEAAILIQGSWAIAQINGSNPDFESKCGVFQFPGVERVIAKSDSLAMSSSTKYPEACAAFMKYFTDDTAQKYTAEIGGKIPVTSVEYDASAAPAQLAYVMDVFGGAKGTFGFYNESMPSTEAGAYFDDQMVAVFLGDMTPAEAATEMETFYADNCR